MAARTVNDSPWPLLWVANFFGAIACALWFLVAVPWGMSLRVRHVGPIPTGGHVLCFWHEWLPVYFLTHLRISGPQVWMQHPVLSMRPIHFILRVMGVRHLAFGSSGHGGKKALEEVIGLLRLDFATVVTPDGPAGPARKAKPGALIMGAEAGVPVVATRYIIGRHIVLPTWDGKILPMPFTQVEIHYQEPLTDINISLPETEIGRLEERLG